MSKLIKYLSLFIVLISLSLEGALANSLTIQKNSMPVKLSNKISQSISLFFPADGQWRLLVEPLDTKIINQDYPNYSIPISRMELAELGGLPIDFFEVGKALEISNQGIYSGNCLNLALNVLLNDSDKPGWYISDVKFTLMIGAEIIAEDVFTLRFSQEEIAKIDFTKQAVYMDFKEENVLRKDSSQNINSPLGVYISSNKDWKLYLRRLKIEQKQPFRYFARIICGASDINSSYQNDYVRITDAPILVASGKATSNEMTKTLERKLIHIDYMVKGPQNRFVPTGSSAEEFEYRLEMEN